MSIDDKFSGLKYAFAFSAVVLGLGLAVSTYDCTDCRGDPGYTRCIDRHYQLYEGQRIPAEHARQIERNCSPYR